MSPSASPETVPLEDKPFGVSLISCLIEDENPTFRRSLGGDSMFVMFSKHISLEKLMSMHSFDYLLRIFLACSERNGATSRRHPRKWLARQATAVAHRDTTVFFHDLYVAPCIQHEKTVSEGEVRFGDKACSRKPAGQNL